MILHVTLLWFTFRTFASQRHPSDADISISAEKGLFSSVVCKCTESAYTISTKHDLDTLNKWVLEQNEENDKFPFYLGIFYIINM